MSSPNSSSPNSSSPNSTSPNSINPDSKPPSFTRSWLLIFLLLVLVVTYPLLRRSESEDQGTRHPAVGRHLTELTLFPLPSPHAVPSDSPAPPEIDSLNHSDSREGQEFEGKVSLLNFWGTWCFPCRLELPHLAKLHAEWREDERVRFFFVSCDDPLSLPELAQRTSEFLLREGLDLPVYADPGQVSRRHLSQVAAFGGGFSYPTTIILDDQQRIRGLWRGFQEEDLIEQAELLQELLP